jgi:hypothetical protein
VPFNPVRAGGSSLRVIIATRNVNVAFLPAPPKHSIVVYCFGDEHDRFVNGERIQRG